MIRLDSLQDRSVNFILPTRHQFEARYVQRDEDSKIFYVSSQSGCSQGCRFCWLTATKQTAGVNATKDDYLRQLEPLIAHAKQVGTDHLPTHVNFMARGEPFVNPHFLRSPKKILESMESAIGGRVVFKISTILPETVMNCEVPFADLEWGPQLVDLYVSYYSSRFTFHHKWMPNACRPTDVVHAALAWTELCLGDVYLHRALIKGENDSLEETHEWCRMVKHPGVRPKVNLIAYNPPPGDSHEAADPERIEAIAAITREYFPTQVQVVQRVGYDVKASCGMFVASP